MSFSSITEAVSQVPALSPAFPHVVCLPILPSCVPSPLSLSGSDFSGVWVHSPGAYPASNPLHLYGSSSLSCSWHWIVLPEITATHHRDYPCVVLSLCFVYFSFHCSYSVASCPWHLSPGHTSAISSLLDSPGSLLTGFSSAPCLCHLSPLLILLELRSLHDYLQISMASIWICWFPPIVV